MDVDTVWAEIDRQRAEVADLLGTFTEEDWGTPSLCEAWTVREVAAHLTLAHMGPLPAVVGLVRARGSFNAMIRDTALRQARLPVEEYAGLLRAMVGSRSKAPGVTPLEPLLDVLVHTQDMLRPLGRSRAMPVEAAATAADRAWRMGFPFGARKRLAGFRLEATDGDWAAGEGAVVTGTSAALLLLVTGRDVVAPELTGPGADQLRARLASAGRA